MENSTHPYVYKVIFDSSIEDPNDMNQLIPQYEEFFESHGFKALDFRVVSSPFAHQRESYTSWDKYKGLKKSGERLKTPTY